MKPKLKELTLLHVGPNKTSLFNSEKFSSLLTSVYTDLANAIFYMPKGLYGENSNAVVLYDENKLPRGVMGIGGFTNKENVWDGLDRCKAAPFVKVLGIKVEPLTIVMDNDGYPDIDLRLNFIWNDNKYCFNGFVK